jgi:hypothetical protein
VLFYLDNCLARLKKGLQAYHLATEQLNATMERLKPFLSYFQVWDHFFKKAAYVFKRLIEIVSIIFNSIQIDVHVRSFAWDLQHIIRCNQQR